jgi:phosphomannomutase/phosphoglucomutase
MIRIFSILSAFTIVMILIAGGGIYWLLQMDVNQARQTATEAVAKGLALGISSQVNTLQDTVSKMAATDMVISAVESKEPQQLEQTALMLETILPRVMKIRILLADVSELDETSIPHMGNADLVMVRDTLTNKQNPYIQGEGTNRHLAITAAIKSNNVVIGVILASLEFDFLQPSLNKFQFSEMDLDLKQGNTTLAKVGDPSTDTNTGNKVVIEQTAWRIYYQPGNIIDVGALSVIICIILLPVLLACMAFFVSYRKLTADLRQDQGSILKAAKDLISGKSVGSYPIILTEMKAVISTLIQFKRVLDNEGKELSTATDDTEIDDFFDEPEGISFLEMDEQIEETVDSFQTTESSPLSLSLTEEQTNAAPPPTSIFSSDSKPPVESNKK